MRRLAPVLVALLALASLAACGDDSSGEAGDAAVFTEPGTRFDVGVGEEFTIVLESNASTGFAWGLEAELDPAVLELVDDVYVEADTDLVGAPGRQELTLRAVGEGSTSVRLWYVRSFDDQPEPADRAQFEVVVSSDVPD